MAIKAYIGLQGHGKTYEVVSVVIYNAIKQGRRVISNIAGLNIAEFHRLIKEENPAAENLGTIVNVAHEAVLNADFWLTDATIETERNEYQIQRGDLVVLDEIWRFWDGFSNTDNEGKKRPSSVMNFCRMHRHMTHKETGISCDLAFISQDVMDFHRSIRGVIEETYRMTQLIAVGMPNRYRVDVFSKTKIVKEPQTSIQGEYKSKYFALYQSHSLKKEGDAKARQVNIDKRGNILKGKIFFALGVLVIVAAFAVYILWGFFHPKPKESDNAQTPVTGSTLQTTPQAAPEVPAVSSSWVIKGHYQKGDGYTLVLENEKGAYRYVSAPMIVFAGLEIRASVDGQVYTNWQAPKSNQTGLMQP